MHSDSVSASGLRRKSVSHRRTMVEPTRLPEGFGNKYEMTAAGPRIPTRQPVLVNISSIEEYRRTLLFQQLGYSGAQIRQLGGGASQLSIRHGKPGDFRESDRCRCVFRRRLEVQGEPDPQSRSAIGNRSRNIVPVIRPILRTVLGWRWAPGAGGRSKGKRRLSRAGFGMFYDRFALGNVLTAERYKGDISEASTSSLVRISILSCRRFHRCPVLCPRARYKRSARRCARHT